MLEADFPSSSAPAAGEPAPTTAPRGPGRGGDRGRRGVLFDLDGVLVTTDEFHYRAWRALADRLGVPFDRRANEALRGVSRMDSLRLLLGDRARDYPAGELVEMAEWKNRLYQAFLADLTPAAVLPGVDRALDELTALGCGLAVASSSRNAGLILQKTGLRDRFAACVDGWQIARSKPDPEVFLKAAERLGLSPSACLVVEDAEAGVSAGLAAGMKVLAVGYAAGDARAHWRAPDLREIPWSQLT